MVSGGGTVAVGPTDEKKVDNCCWGGRGRRGVLNSSCGTASPASDKAERGTCIQY